MKRLNFHRQFAIRHSPFAICLLCLLAFALRTHQLDGRPLWSDEGLSVYRARQDVGTILRNEIIVQDVVTYDTQPPLYFLLLHGWRALVGESEFALKFPSVAWGVLLVPLLFATGRRLLGSGTGWGAALLGALSPLWVWYSQELRMYTMLTALGLLAIYALGRGLQENRLVWVLTAGLVTAAALYTHYGAVFLLVVEALLLLTVTLLRRRWLYLGGLLLAVGLTIPLVPVALRRLGAGVEVHFNFVPLRIILWDAWRAFTLGFSGEGPGVWPALLLVLMLFAWGLVDLVRRRRWLGLVVLPAYLLVPVLGVYGLSLLKPAYQGPRHIMLGSPALYLGLGTGTAAIVRRWRAGGALPLLVVALVMAQATGNSFDLERFGKDDYRSLARYVAAHERPGDVLLMNDAVLTILMDYYYPGDLPVLALPHYGRGIDETLDGELTQVGQQYRRIWFVPLTPICGSDPGQWVHSWLDGHYVKLKQIGFPSYNTTVSLELYATHWSVVNAKDTKDTKGLPEGTTLLSVQWPQALELVGYRGPEVMEAASKGDFVLYWRAPQPLTRRYLASLQLVDSEGRVWAREDDPILRYLPLRRWPVGKVVYQEHEMPLPVGIPPGRYTLQVSLLPLDGDTPLSTADGKTAIPLRSLEVLPASRPIPDEEVPYSFPVRRRFGEMAELVGYRWSGREQRPGLAVLLDLYWRALRPAPVDYQLNLELIDAQGQRRALAWFPGVVSWYPPSRWQAGEVIRAQVALLIPADVESGRYYLRAALCHPQTGECLPVSRPWWRIWEHQRTALDFAEVEVRAWPYLGELPPMQHEVQALLGDVAWLRGYDLEPTMAHPGETLDLTLYWQGVNPPQKMYDVFVHLLDDNGITIAWGDAPPVNGVRPTTSWRSGEVIVDEHRIPLPATLPPGRYTLVVGLYDPETYQRVPVTGDGDQVALGEITIGEQSEH